MTKQLTPEQKAKYIESGFNHCPLCKSDDIETDKAEFHGNSATQNVRCMDCGAEWEDTYILSNIEITDDAA